jgi:hypothetical protein
VIFGYLFGAIVWVAVFLLSYEYALCYSSISHSIRSSGARTAGFGGWSTDWEQSETHGWPHDRRASYGTTLGGIISPRRASLDEYLPVSTFPGPSNQCRHFVELKLGEGQARLLLLCCLGRYSRAVKAFPSQCAKAIKHSLTAWITRPPVCPLLSHHTVAEYQ